MSTLSLEEFADRINEILPAMLKELVRREGKELYKDNITLPQCLILQLLFKEGELKMTALAHLMKVSTAAMTGIVDRLVRDRYVERNYDPEDRRIINIKLTPKGKNLIKKFNQQRRQMVIKIFSKISDSDRQDYLRIITQVKDILTQENLSIK